MALSWLAGRRQASGEWLTMLRNWTARALPLEKYSQMCVPKVKPKASSLFSLTLLTQPEKLAQPAPTFVTISNSCDRLSRSSIMIAIDTRRQTTHQGKKEGHDGREEAQKTLIRFAVASSTI